MKPTYSGVAATLALAVALGGTNYAAATLPKNSVASKQVKNESITGKDIKNGSLTAAHFDGSLPAGPQGPQGAQGPQGIQGVAGTARAYARVAADGTVNAANSKGIVGVTTAGLSLLCFELGFTPKNVVADVEAYADIAQNQDYGCTVVGIGAGNSACPATTDAYVATTDVAGNDTRLPVFAVFN